MLSGIDSSSGALVAVDSNGIAESEYFDQGIEVLNKKHSWNPIATYGDIGFTVTASTDAGGINNMPSNVFNIFAKEWKSLTTPNDQWHLIDCKEIKTIDYLGYLSSYIISAFEVAVSSNNIDWTVIIPYGSANLNAGTEDNGFYFDTPISFRYLKSSFKISDSSASEIKIPSIAFRYVDRDAIAGDDLVENLNMWYAGATIKPDSMIIDFPQIVSSTYGIQNLFNNNLNLYYATNDPISGSIDMKYTFNDVTSIEAYGGAWRCDAYYGADSKYHIPDFDLMGSDDGVNFTLIDSRRGIVWEDKVIQKFTLSDPASYKTFKVVPIGRGQNGITISKFSLFSADPAYTGLDFVSANDIVVDNEYANISSATVADTLVSSGLIVDGDKLVIVKDDGSIHEMIASGVTIDSGAEETISAIHTSATEPADYLIEDDGVYSASYAVWKGFDGDSDAGACGLINGHWFTYELPVAKILTGFDMQGYAPTLDTVQTTAVDIYGWDGSSYVFLAHRDFAVWSNLEIRRVDVPNITAFKKYKFQFTVAGSYCGSNIYTMFSAPKSYSMDTSVVTQGEIPSRVYTVGSKVMFDNTELLFDTVDYSGLDPLIGQSKLSAFPLSVSRLKTTVGLKSTGDKCTRIEADLYRD